MTKREYKIYQEDYTRPKTKEKRKVTSEEDDHADIPDNLPFFQVIDLLSKGWGVEHVILDLIQSIQHEGLVV